MPELSEFKQWCIVELMGHVRIAGLVTEEERFGAKLGRIDIPNGDGFTTQFFNGSSLYRMTPTTEEIARAVATSSQPEPIHRWELPRLNAGNPDTVDADEDEDEGLHVGATGYEFSSEDDEASTDYERRHKYDDEELS